MTDIVHLKALRNVLDEKYLQKYTAFRRYWAENDKCGCSIPSNGLASCDHCRKELKKKMKEENERLWELEIEISKKLNPQLRSDWLDRIKP